MSYGEKDSGLSTDHYLLGPRWITQFCQPISFWTKDFGDSINYLFVANVMWYQDIYPPKKLTARLEDDPASFYSFSGSAYYIHKSMVGQLWSPPAALICPGLQRTMMASSIDFLRPIAATGGFFFLRIRILVAPTMGMRKDRVYPSNNWHIW